MARLWATWRPSATTNVQRNQPCCLDGVEKGSSTLLLADSQEAMRVIREHDASIPLFYYIAFQCNHEPLEAPDGYIDM